MDERQIGLALALRELGVSSDVTGFDSRLILQKTVYLLEEAGIHLGYPFNWYLRGPYSPALTRDLYGFSSNTDDLQGWNLDAKSLQISQRLKPLITRPSGEDLATKARRLELAASILYLARQQRINLESAEEAKSQLARNGKHFSTAEVADAIDELKQVGLLVA